MLQAQPELRLETCRTVSLGTLLSLGSFLRQASKERRRRRIGGREEEEEDDSVDEQFKGPGPKAQAGDTVAGIGKRQEKRR